MSVLTLLAFEILRGRGKRLPSPPGVAQGLIHFARHPQVEKKDRELASHRHRRPFLGVLAATLGQLKAPTPEVAVCPQGADRVVGALHQEPAQQLRLPPW